MEIFDIIISTILIIGMGFVLYLYIREPFNILKSLLRMLKSHPFWHIRIISIPIWGPAWIVDKIFGLKLFVKEFEDASSPAKIKFSEYDKYILVSTTNLEHIDKVLYTFNTDFDPAKFNYQLNGFKIKTTEFGENLILKLENEIEFNRFNNLVHYLDNSAPKGNVYNVKGILINNNKKENSYFIFNDTAFPLKLIGKTFKNKKIYVDINPETELNDTIYFNSNMDYFKNLDFDKFENEMHKLKFKELKLKPSP